MTRLLLILALAAPASALARDDDRDQGDQASCSVSVRAFDEHGRARAVKRVSATTEPAVVFYGRVESREDDELPLVFHVFSPRGRLYQVLTATPRVVVREHAGQRFVRTTRVREAALALAGSSIAWTSMYGQWRVEPRILGSDKPCGKPELFTIRP
jgi:hypothetical protein